MFAYFKSFMTKFEKLKSGHLRKYNITSTEDNKKLRFSFLEVIEHELVVTVFTSKEKNIMPAARKHQISDSKCEMEQ